MSPCNKDGSKGAAAPQKPMGRSPAPPHHRRCSEARMLPARPPAPSRTHLRPSRHTELFQVLKILLSLQFLWTAHGCLPLSRCPEAPSWPGVARSPQRLPEGGPQHFGVGPRGAGRVWLGRAPPWGLSAPCALCAKRGWGKPRRPHRIGPLSKVQHEAKRHRRVTRDARGHEVTETGPPARG